MKLMVELLTSVPLLHYSRRQIYFFFHDLGLSHNTWGYLARKAIFSSLSPKGLCNSKFTASKVLPFINHQPQILYQPIDSRQFCPQVCSEIPASLEAILAKGSQILLTPSRLNKPGIVNDKNLRALIPVVAELKRLGKNFHSVIIGEDTSGDGSHTQLILDHAREMDVLDRLTILPPVFNLQDYYRQASAVVTLAPREPFGRTVIEAVACGVPVIGSRTGGIGEILSNFAQSWMVDPENSSEVAKTIIRVCHSFDTEQEIKDGQAWVANHCNLQTYAIKILEVTGIQYNSMQASLQLRS